MVKVKYSFSMQVENGPSLNIPGNYDVEIIESGGVPVTKNTEKTIKVQPLSWDQIEFVIIQSSQYDEKDLIYTIGAAKDVPLNRPHFIIGNSLAKLLGRQQQGGDLKVKNSIDSDVTVSLVVGRKA